jgi:hypothetical protein
MKKSMTNVCFDAINLIGCELNAHGFTMATKYDLELEALIEEYLAIRIPKIDEGMEISVEYIPKIDKSKLIP